MWKLNSRIGFKIVGLWCFGGAHAEQVAHSSSCDACTISGLYPAPEALVTTGPRFLCIWMIMRWSHFGSARIFGPVWWIELSPGFISWNLFSAL